MISFILFMMQMALTKYDEQRTSHSFVFNFDDFFTITYIELRKYKKST